MNKLSAVIGGCLLLVGLWAAAFGQQISTSFSIPATACSNQFIRSVAAATGVGTCATVGSSDLASSLTLTTPNIGVATATSINKVTVTAPATASTLAIQDGTTLTYSQGDCSSTIGFQGSSTAGTGQTYSTRVCSWEQNGRGVTVRFTLSASSLGTAAGNLQINGLPSTSVNVANENGACFMAFYAVTGLAALTYGVTGIISPNTSLIGSLVSNSNTSGSIVTVTQAGLTPSMEGFCNYRAS